MKLFTQSVRPLLKSTALILSASVALSAFAASSTAATYTTDNQKLGYTMGYEMGKGLSQQGVSIDPAAFQAGYIAGSTKAKPALSETEMKTVTEQYRQKMIASMKKEQAAQSAKLNQEAQANEAASSAFLTKISKESGVQKISDGVYYKIIKQGSGALPKATDTVTVNYEGSLINGTVFDSSYKRGQPASIPLNAVIPGWSAAITHMPVGSTWMIYISPEQAYGKYAPAIIGPNQTLIFKVELIKIDSSSNTDAKK